MQKRSLRLYGDITLCRMKYRGLGSQVWRVVNRGLAPTSEMQRYSGSQIWRVVYRGLAPIDIGDAEIQRVPGLARGESRARVHGDTDRDTADPRLGARGNAGSRQR